MTNSKKKANTAAIKELCEIFLLFESREEVYNFLQDLCTPQEVRSIAERWRVCKLLGNSGLPYREINKITGASLTTIGRVARFLRTERNQGYIAMLQKIKKED